MSLSKFKSLEVSECIDELLYIGDRISQLQQEIISFSRTLDKSQRAIKTIYSAIYYIDLARSGSQFISYGVVTKECCEIYINNEQYLINYALAESNQKEVKSSELVNTFGKTIDAYDLSETVADLGNIFGNGMFLSGFFNNKAVKKSFKIADNVDLIYQTYIKVAQGDYEGALLNFYQEGQERIPDWVASVIGGSVGPLEGVLYLNFGKSIGDNFLEHYELLFSKSSGNFIKDLADITWGMTAETLYDFGMETGLDIVEKGAALLGIDYSEVLINLTGKDGMEGVNLMMESMSNELMKGAVKVVQDVGSFCSNMFNDAGKAIGGWFS